MDIHYKAIDFIKSELNRRNNQIKLLSIQPYNETKIAKRNGHIIAAENLLYILNLINRTAHVACGNEPQERLVDTAINTDEQIKEYIPRKERLQE